MHIITYTTESGIERELTFDASQINAVMSLTARLLTERIHYSHIFEE